MIQSREPDAFEARGAEACWQRLEPRGKVEPGRRLGFVVVVGSWPCQGPEYAI